MPATSSLGPSDELLPADLADSDDMIVILGDDGRVQHANEAASRLLALISDSPCECCELTPVDADDRRAVTRRLERAGDHASTEPTEIEPLVVRITQGDGRWIDVEASGFTPIRTPDGPGVVVVVRDLSAGRDIDAMDELPGREVLTGRLESLARRVDRSGRSAHVLMVRLGELEGLREIHGVTGVTAIVRTWAAAVRDHVRDRWTVATAGPGEIVVLTEPGETPLAVDELATELLALAETVAAELGEPADLASTVGIAALRPAGDVGAVVAQAAAAARVATDLASPAPVFYDAAMRDDLGGRHAAIAEVRRALAAGELIVHYQPILEMRTDRVYGFEALLRWNHPAVGLISAGEFLPDLEGTAAMNDIGTFVLETACRQLATWQTTYGASAPFVSVNVSARQLRDGGFASRVRRNLRRSGADGAGLCIELTETHALEWESASFSELGAIRDLGVRLALDDFGTGYSSLHHLDRLGADVLKIDRSFVARLGRDPGAEAIVKASIELGVAFGMETVAEGVTNHRQRDRLRELGCDHVQGFLVAPAVGVDVADAMLRADSARAIAGPPRGPEVLARIADAQAELRAIDDGYRPSDDEVAALAGVAPAIIGQSHDSSAARPALPIGGLLSAAV